METHWHAPIDIYCERADAGFWAEPVNALTNAAFLVAAALALAAWRRDGGRDRPALLLIGVVAVVGIGSFLFHTFANRWSLLADVIPIALFIYGFFALAMRRLVGLAPIGALAATLAFFGASALFPRAFAALFGPEATLNGSVGYLPAALALVGVGGFLALRARRAARVLANPKNRAYAPVDEAERARVFLARVAAPRTAGATLLLAAGVFAASLVFRSIDEAVCAATPFGTHFLWHVLNAAVLYLCLRAALEHRRIAGGA